MQLLILVGSCWVPLPEPPAFIYPVGGDLLLRTTEGGVGIATSLLLAILVEADP